MSEPSHNQDGRRVFVKGDDTASFTSRKITMATRPDSKKGLPVRVFAKRAAAVNVAVKAIAIATSKLAEDPDGSDGSGGDDNPSGHHVQTHIIAVPSFRDNRNEVSLYVEDVEKVKPNAILCTELSEFTVGSKTDPKTAAGAIASSARERKSITVQSIGAEAVFNAVRSVAIAREYLRDKDDKIDLFFKVEFTKVRFEGRDEDTTAVKLTCYLHEGEIP